MGKIRVAALGSEEEKKLKEAQKVRREEKKKREAADKVHISGMKGGERIKSVSSMDDTEADKMIKLAHELEATERGDATTDEETTEKKKKKKKFQGSSRSQRYLDLKAKVSPTKTYSVPEALSLLREVSYTKFDATAELHVNVVEKGIRGTVQLPHGTGKTIRVVIADAKTIEKLIETIESGTIAFDALVAHPSVMPKLAKVAKFLGPKGLMPNPKNGTISPNPEQVAEKLKGGEVTWKTESDHPIIHQAIGKMSFKDKQLEENIQAFISSVAQKNIKTITLKSTMSPGIKITL